MFVVFVFWGCIMSVLKIWFNDEPVIDWIVKNRTEAINIIYSYIVNRFVFDSVEYESDILDFVSGRKDVAFVYYVCWGIEFFTSFEYID